MVENGSISLLEKGPSICLGVLKLGLTGKINNVKETTEFPKLRDIKVRLTIDPKIKPVQQPLRRVPVAVGAKLEGELKEVLSLKN